MTYTTRRLGEVDLDAEGTDACGEGTGEEELGHQVAAEELDDPCRGPQDVGR